MTDGGMTKGKFETVRELVKLGRLAEARAILETINTAQAQEWLKKITEIQHRQLYGAAEQPVIVRKRARDRSPATHTRFNWGIGVMVIGTFLIAAIAYTVIRQSGTPDITLPPTPTDPPAPTLFQLPVVEFTPTEAITPVIVPALPTLTATSTVVPATSPFIPSTTPDTFDWTQALQGRVSDCEKTVDYACANRLTDQASRGEKPEDNP